MSKGSRTLDLRARFNYGALLSSSARNLNIVTEKYANR